MSQEVVIQIRLTLPDGASYRVTTVPEAEPRSVLEEPLPPEPMHYGTNEPDGAFLVAADVPISARRGIAIQQGVVWAAGQVHLAGHKPLRAGAKGSLFCPTPTGKAPDGSTIFCQFHP